jgi:uncharacterized protein
MLMRIDMGAQHGVHPRQMPLPLLSEPLLNLAVEAQVHGCFSARRPFLRTAEIYSNETIGKIEDREDDGEPRHIALGRVETDVYRVVYTWRAENLIRVISAQNASKNEREIYFREIFAQRD